MSQGQDLAQEHMDSKWQSRENQMLTAFTMLGAPPQFNLFPMIFPALRAGNDGVWQANLHTGIINAKFQCHPSQGHCILMSVVQLYNTKGYFSGYKISGFHEKLVGEVFLEYGNILTPFKSHYFQGAHWMTFLSPRGSPSSEVVDLCTCWGLEYRQRGFVPVIYGKICVVFWPPTYSSNMCRLPSCTFPAQVCFSVLSHPVVSDLWP